MQDIMREKNEALQRQNEEKKAQQPTGESIEERAARLKAHRDLLRKQKEDKRQAELDSFNKKLETQDSGLSIGDQMRQIDAGTKGVPS